MATTSFQKKARVKIGQIPGTRPSLYNNQLLVSTGIPSLDNVIGGGLGVGTVLMVEEDLYGNYARLMMKYFAAEAVMTRQSLLITSVDTDPQQLVKELPCPVDTNHKRTPQRPAISGNSSSEPPGGSQKPLSDNKMKIAWRYENKPMAESSHVSSVSFGHYYDLTKTMDGDRLSQADVAYSQPVSLSDKEKPCRCPIQGMNTHYCRLLQDIRDKIDDGNFGTDRNVKERNVLRIGIHSIGSPLWSENGGLGSNSHDYNPSLALFLLALRSMLRSALAVAVVTVPTHLFQESHVTRLHGMCDTVVRLESFAGSQKEKNPVFKEYHGLLHLVRLPRVNSLVPAQPETSDLAFKLRRKKFTIEKLHLPPDLSDTASRSQNEAKSSAGGCGTSHSSSPLDF